MLELPEAFNMSKQIEDTLIGKEIVKVIPLQSPHKLTWFNGDPEKYPEMLVGKTLDKAYNLGGMIKIDLGITSLLFSDGINLRFIKNKKDLPKKHQLLIEFKDSSFLCSSTQMYGGVVCFQNGIYENEYYKTAIEKPSPLTDSFTRGYFQNLLREINPSKTNTKAFLATKQRIPGLGNGVLQDILFNSSIHPKKKIGSLTDSHMEKLYNSIISTLQEMSKKGGRDTEKDLFGNECGYHSILSKKTMEKPCPNCSGQITKASYMGGSVYFCETCQLL